MTDAAHHPEAAAFTGIRIVELAGGIPGPYATMFLADHGADVIKVEPAGGDPYRSEPGFYGINRNKRSVVCTGSGELTESVAVT